MAEKDNTTVSFKADIAELKKEFRNAATIIRVANSEFKKASAGLDDWSKDADGVTAKCKQLNTIIEAQCTQLSSLEKQYKKVAEREGENSTGAQNLLIQINNLKASIKNNEKQLENYSDSAKRLSAGLDDAKDSAKETSGGFTVLKGALADLVADGIKAAISGFKDLVKASKEAYDEYDQGMDNVVKATGATGEVADKLQSSYKKVSQSVIGDFSDIGSALGEVNTRFGFTGSSLEECTTDFMKFADITGTDAVTAVQLVSRAMGDAGIDSEKYKDVLDELAIAAQASGITIDTLAESITKYGAPMRALGFDTKESIAIFSGWEKAGVNTEIAFSGMKIAISKWADSGKDSREEFKKTLEEIAACPDIAAATTKAIEVFGKKAGPDLADAIQGGRFEYEDFLSLVESSSGTLDKTYDETQSGMDKIKLAVQNARTEVADFIFGIVEEYKPEIEKFIKAGVDGFKKLLVSASKNMPAIKNTVSKVVTFFKDSIKWIIENFDDIKKKAKIAGTAIGAMFITNKIIGFVTGIMKLVKTYTTLKAAIEATTTAQKLMNLTNPAGIATLAAGAIAGLTVAIVNFSNETPAVEKEFSKLSKQEQELRDKTNELIESYEDWKSTRDQHIDDIGTEYGAYEQLAAELDSIVDKNGRIKSGYEDRATTITTVLADALGHEIKIVDGVVQKYGEVKKELKETIALQQAQAAQDTMKDDYLEAKSKVKDALISYKDNLKAYSDAMARYKLAQTEMNTLNSITAEQWAELSQAPEWAEYSLLTYSEACKYAEDKINGLSGPVAAQCDALNKSRDAYTRYATTIQNYEEVTAAIVSGDTQMINDAMSKMYNGFQTVESGTKVSLQKQLENYKSNLVSLENAVREGMPGVTQAQVDEMRNLVELAQAEYDKAPDEMGRTLDSMVQTVASRKSAMMTESSGLGAAVTGPVEADLSRLPGIAGAKAGSMADTVRNARGQMESAGYYAAEGAAVGAESGSGLLANAANSLAGRFVNTFRRILRIQSPSRVMMKLGGYVSEGLAIGIANGAKDVIGSAKALARDAIDTMDRETEGFGNSIFGSINAGLPQLRRAITPSTAISGGSVVNNNYSTTSNCSYNQTNISPKPLRLEDTYRQTKSLLRLKGV